MLSRTGQYGDPAPRPDRSVQFKIRDNDVFENARGDVREYY